jgi:beta-lactamase class A
VGGLAYWDGYREAAAHYKALLASFTPLSVHDADYPLIAPLLGVHAPEATELGEYTALKSAIQNDITDATNAGGVNEVSVYFRDLNTSEWLGINQDADYYPASLLKVPVMIAYYKEAESDPSILDQEVTYQNITAGDPFDAPSDLTPGKTYTVDQLIDAMIISSDNGATLTLLNLINQDDLNDVYANLGIANPGTNSASYQISTRTYALFFRILYNATYLDPEYSQKALDLLSQATFSDGLVAGLPEGVAAAHKFGEHVLTNASSTEAEGVELSDCGVVYYPSHPYLLCVMTSTASVENSESIIKDISATTYAAVNQEYATSTASK